MALYTLDLHRHRSHENALRYELEKKKVELFNPTQAENGLDMEQVYGKTRYDTCPTFVSREEIS
jgi:hypothetical protein